MTISNEQLRDAFLGPNMKFYFDRKLQPLASDEVDARIEELLKYLNMAIYCNGGIPFSKDIDDVWHYWILETAEYARLCEKLHGGGFFHHTSNDYAAFTDKDAKTRKVDIERGVEILVSYVLNYGPMQPDRVAYWPLAGQLMSRLEWDLDALNEWLSQAASANSGDAGNGARFAA